MLNGIFSYIGDFLTGIFAFIPQMMYFVYTCAASILDFLQYVVRKLAGLDVYYINGQEQQGDIILSLIKGVLGIETDTSASYSTLSTVFWSMIIFAVVILVLATIIKLVTAHYNYNPDTSNPMTIIKGSIKTLMTLAIVPIVTVFGIQISNVLLKTLDQISSGSSSTTIAAVYKNSAQDYKNVFEAGEDSWGYHTFTSYDFFGFGAYTNSATVSGQLFSVAANSANRVRKGTYTPHASGSGDHWSNHGIFSSSASDEATRREEVAYMIDYAFANNLTLQDRKTASVLMLESSVLISSFTYFQSAVWYLGTIEFKTFSKYNVGLVWYYYNLWGFNFFVALAGLSVTMTLLINIVFGMVVRMINVFALFLVYPVLLGINPLDEGKAFNSWKSEFISNIFMSYGAVVGMNIVFMILPLLQNISFFNSLLPDLIFNMVILIGALLSIKKVIATFSQLVGGKDAQAEGAEAKEESKKIAFAGAEKAIKVARLAVKVAATIYSGGAALAVEAAKEIAKKKAKDEIIKKIMQKIQKKKAKEGAEQAKKQGAEQAKAAQEEAKEQAAEQEQQAKQTEKSAEQDKQEEKDESQEEATESQEESKEGAEDKKQEDAKDSADKEEEKDEDSEAENALVKLAEKFRSSLGQKDGGEDFGVDQETADKTKKWYDEQIKSVKASREKAKGSALSDEEIAELEDDVKDQATEKFLRGSSGVNDLAAKRGKKSVDEKKKKFGNAVGKVKKPFAAAGKAFKKVGSSLSESALFEVASQSLKVIGSFSGVTSSLKKQLSEAGVLDAGIETVREFAQAMGASAEQMASLPKTKKMKEDEKKEQKTREANAVGTAKSYSKAVKKQMEQIILLVKEMESKKK